MPTAKTETSLLKKIIAIVPGFRPEIFAFGNTFGTESVTAITVAGSKFGVLLLLCALFSCSEKKPESAALPDLFLLVTGTAQDAGYPQAGCLKSCCEAVHSGRQAAKKVVSLSLIDRSAGKFWVFEATPDFPEQLRISAEKTAGRQARPEGIFLTHAHIGHYTGLMHLGREVMGATKVPVFALPRMADFLRQNEPWKQLSDLQNIDLQTLKPDSAIKLSDRLSVRPFLVPHRDEHSETAGYLISSPDLRILFIPDINKWATWERNIVEEIRQADYAFLDATFFRNGEIPGRDMSEIPHPFVEESMRLFDELSPEDRRKVKFIHFNHTNPLLGEGPERQSVLQAGFQIAEEGEIIDLTGK